MKRMTEEYGKTVEEAIRKGLETLTSIKERALEETEALGGK